MAEKINGRVAYADLLRVLSVLAAILLTLAGSQMARVSVDSQAFQVFNLYDGLTRWCIPVFVMLSGMFLLDKGKALPLSRLFFHHCLRILVCLMVWNGLYAVVEYCAAGGGFSLWGLWLAIRGSFLSEPHYHLRFLFVFLGLYLVTPILRAFVRGAGRSDLHYFFLLAFLFASLLPMCFRLWPNATAGVRLWYERLNIQLVMGYVGFYVAGHYLRAYTISRLAEAVVYVLGILGAVVTVWGTAVFSRRAGVLSELFYDPFAPNVAAFAIAVVVLFRYVLGVSEERSRRQRLGGVAQLCFGIYLVHDLFIMLLRSFGITTLSFAPVASVPVLTAVVFLCSLAAAWLISKLPFLGPWLT